MPHLVCIWGPRGVAALRMMALCQLLMKPLSFGSNFPAEQTDQLTDQVLLITSPSCPGRDVSYLLY